MTSDIETPNNDPYSGPPRRTRVNPEEMIGPNCMFWAMVVGFVVLGGMMLTWGIANLDKIAR